MYLMNHLLYIINTDDYYLEIKRTKILTGGVEHISIPARKVQEQSKNLILNLNKVTLLQLMKALNLVEVSL